MRNHSSAAKKKSPNLVEIESTHQAGGPDVRTAPGAAAREFRAIRPLASALAGSDACLGEAQTGLLNRAPEFSAAIQLWPWQKRALLILIALATAVVVLAPDTALIGLYAALAVPFFFVAVLRILALWHFATAGGPVAGKTSPGPLPAELPVYSVLVPLYHEAEVVPALVDALTRLVYPPERLQILLILEDGDAVTRAAVAATDLPDTMQVVVVPDGAPRTKPRALNYALSFATGDYVVVYDAEDVPEPDQLLKALRVFAEDQGRLGCVQARLNIYNSRQSPLTRQFTIEYTALFDIMLPVLEWLSLPVPLGGTSNHFPRKVLDQVGGWDPFNVTEDADLGIRLERAGWRARVLDSTTWEEAPATYRTWRGQRTRWLKGWIQTWLVHTRQPMQLWRELGAWKFMGLQMLMGGMVLAALVHPWFYVLLAHDWWNGTLFEAPRTAVGEAMLWLGVVNLAAGYLGAILLGVLAVRRRGDAGIAWSLLWMPVYWLGISLAAYRALVQLIFAPHLWEKTQHSARDVSTQARVSGAACRARP
jgi:cellulose synthase/poly-beta-1,6-N-acetylglucosamine synthase-like glycosyltransferase